MGKSRTSRGAGRTNRLDQTDLEFERKSARRERKQKSPETVDSVATAQHLVVEQREQFHQESDQMRPVGMSPAHERAYDEIQNAMDVLTAETLDEIEAVASSPDQVVVATESEQTEKPRSVAETIPSLSALKADFQELQKSVGKQSRHQEHMQEARDIIRELQRYANRYGHDKYNNSSFATKSEARLQALINDIRADSASGASVVETGAPVPSEASKPVMRERRQRPESRTTVPTERSKVEATRLTAEVLGLLGRMERDKSMLMAADADRYRELSQWLEYGFSNLQRVPSQDNVRSLTEVYKQAKQWLKKTLSSQRRVATPTPESSESAPEHTASVASEGVGSLDDSGQEHESEAAPWQGPVVPPEEASTGAATDPIDATPPAETPGADPAEAIDWQGPKIEDQLRHDPTLFRSEVLAGIPLRRQLEIIFEERSQKEPGLFNDEYRSLFSEALRALDEAQQLEPTVPESMRREFTIEVTVNGLARDVYDSLVSAYPTGQSPAEVARYVNINLSNGIKTFRDSWLPDFIKRKNIIEQGREVTIEDYPDLSSRIDEAQTLLVQLEAYKDNDLPSQVRYGRQRYDSYMADLQQAIADAKSRPCSGTIHSLQYYYRAAVRLDEELAEIAQQKPAAVESSLVTEPVEIASEDVEAPSAEPVPSDQTETPAAVTGDLNTTVESALTTERVEEYRREYEALARDVVDHGIDATISLNKIKAGIEILTQVLANPDAGFDQLQADTERHLREEMDLVRAELSKQPEPTAGTVPEPEPTSAEVANGGGPAPESTPERPAVPHTLEELVTQVRQTRQMVESAGIDQHLEFQFDEIERDLIELQNLYDHTYTDRLDYHFADEVVALEQSVRQRLREIERQFREGLTPSGSTGSLDQQSVDDLMAGLEGGSGGSAATPGGPEASGRPLGATDIFDEREVTDDPEFDWLGVEPPRVVDFSGIIDRLKAEMIFRTAAHIEQGPDAPLTATQERDVRASAERLAELAKWETIAANAKLGQAIFEALIRTDDSGIDQIVAELGTEVIDRDQLAQMVAEARNDVITSQATEQSRIKTTIKKALGKSAAYAGVSAAAAWATGGMSLAIQGLASGAIISARVAENYFLMSRKQQKLYEDKLAHLSHEFHNPISPLAQQATEVVRLRIARQIRERLDQQTIPHRETLGPETIDLDHRLIDSFATEFEATAESPEQARDLALRALRTLRWVERENDRIQEKVISGDAAGPLVNVFKKNKIFSTILGGRSLNTREQATTTVVMGAAGFVGRHIPIVRGLMAGVAGGRLAGQLAEKCLAENSPVGRLQQYSRYSPEQLAADPEVYQETSLLLKDPAARRQDEASFMTLRDHHQLATNILVSRFDGLLTNSAELTKAQKKYLQEKYSKDNKVALARLAGAVGGFMFGEAAGAALRAYVEPAADSSSVSGQADLAAATGQEATQAMSSSIPSAPAGAAVSSPAVATDVVRPGPLTSGSGMAGRGIPDDIPHQEQSAPGTSAADVAVESPVAEIAPSIPSNESPLLKDIGAEVATDNGHTTITIELGAGDVATLDQALRRLVAQEMPLGSDATLSALEASRAENVIANIREIMGGRTIAGISPDQLQEVIHLEGNQLIVSDYQALAQLINGQNGLFEHASHVVTEARVETGYNRTSTEKWQEMIAQREARVDLEPTTGGAVETSTVPAGPATTPTAGMAGGDIANTLEPLNPSSVESTPAEAATLEPLYPTTPAPLERVEVAVPFTAEQYLGPAAAELPAEAVTDLPRVWQEAGIDGSAWRHMYEVAGYKLEVFMVDGAFDAKQIAMAQRLLDIPYLHYTPEQFAMALESTRVFDFKPEQELMFAKAILDPERAHIHLEPIFGKTETIKADFDIIPGKGRINFKNLGEERLDGEIDLRKGTVRIGKLMGQAFGRKTNISKLIDTVQQFRS